MTQDSRVVPNNEVIEYTTAESMAATYKDATQKLIAAMDEIQRQCGILRATFNAGTGFDVDFYYRGQERDQDQILNRMKLDAWRAIIDKLGIWRVMSSGRAKQLQDALEGRSTYGEKAKEFPEIDPETIVQVAKGYASSVTEFLEEAVKEEYEFWRPHLSGYASANDYKTNKGSSRGLKRKVIRGYMVERGYNGWWRANYNSQCHLVALDNIFHLLAGLGPIEGHSGPLCDAIASCQGHPCVAETQFFHVRGFLNGNIHLTFKRLDLLKLFNRICGHGDRIGDEDR